jgi:hypothetical protein
MKYLSVIILIFWSCTSCNENKHENDIDRYDVDFIEKDESADDASNPDLETSDLAGDEDEAEEDDIPDPVEFPDMYEDPYGTFYPDSDQHIAYKYYGDYPDQNASDPERVGRLWEKFYQTPEESLACVPTPFDACFEHYPFEPQLIDGDGWCGIKKDLNIGTFQCDAILTPGCWDGDFLSSELMVNERNGKLMMGLGSTSVDHAVQAQGIHVYDLEKRQLILYGRSLFSGWQNDRYIFIETVDKSKNRLNKNEPDYHPYKYIVYYDKKEKRYGYAWKMEGGYPIDSVTDFRASETHLFMTAFFETGENSYDAKIMYTKVGEWDKWKEITYKKETLSGTDRRTAHPSMFDQYVTYYDVQLEVHMCDLTKDNGGCFRVSKQNEYARHPKIKDKNTIFYVVDRLNSSDGVSELVKADLTNPSDIKYEILFANDNSTIIKDVSDEFINYIVLRDYGLGENVYQGDICYYRFKDKKTFCLDTEIDKKLPKRHSFIYRHMLVFTSEYNYVADIVVRDMECYCDLYPDKCPFDDYTPNPENSKKPWK